MTDELLGIINNDINRCETAQSQKEGSYRLYQSLVGKYNGIFKDFENDIPEMAKCSSLSGEFDYRSELVAIKEKLQIIVATEHENDPLYGFKRMYDEDLAKLEIVINDKNNHSTTEEAKNDFYKEITAKYHPYVPQFCDGLYECIPELGFYEDVSGETLFHNLKQIYNKLKSYKALGFPNIITSKPQQTAPQVNITNTNENKIDITVSFFEVKRKVEKMTALKDEEIDEVLKKIDEIEDIVKSSDRKSKKWDNAKEIIKWLADKSVDVGIALLPLLLQIK